MEMTMISKLKSIKNNHIIRAVKQRYIIEYNDGNCNKTWVIKGYTNKTLYRVLNFFKRNTIFQLKWLILIYI